MSRTFTREDGGLVQEQRRTSPLDRFVTKAFETILIAVLVFFATTWARTPETTASELQDHDKRLALIEQSLGDMKTDLKEIKHAVIKR